jgi:hypothetical protein
VLDLQRTLIRTLRGQRAGNRAVEPSDAGDLVNLVAGLLDLVVDPGHGEPLFARVAAAHWPTEPRMVGRSVPEFRFAYLPVQWRFLAMAVVAAVVVEPGHDTDDVLTLPRRTLAASLTDAEWRRWEERMVVWPPAIRKRLAAARRECC